MAEDMTDWKPMEEDFKSFTVNSYDTDQTAAHLPIYLLPPSVTPNENHKQTIKLYVDGFPSDLTETGLKNFLKRIGCQVLKVQIIGDKQLRKKKTPFGFIDFESTKEAQNAIQLIKNQKLYKLFVYFTATDNDLKQKKGVLGQEFKEFREQVSKDNN